VSGVAFDQKDGVNILKGYMESGEFSRGRDSIRADGGIVMVGNFDVDVWEQLRSGHLLAPLPKEMRDDTAFMDRIHAFYPGWDVPKLDPSYFSDHFGFVSDFLAEVWSQLRQMSRLDAIQGRIEWGKALSGRDRKAANNTIDGLLKLLYPDSSMEIPDDDLAWAADLALEFRRRVKEQQAAIGIAEFGNIDLSYRIGSGADKVVYCQETILHRQRQAAETPLPTPTGLPAPDREEIATSKGTKARQYGVGDLIGDRFEVLETLGQGGFAQVFRVLDRLEGEERAFKLFENAAGYDAVRREIGALRKIDHPHVVKVLWADKTSEGEWYLITEFVEGEMLEEYARGRKHLRDREAVDVALDILDALTAIHPDSARLEELSAKNRDGGLSPAEFEEMQG
ncbi:MAG: BREX system Lon protease-like protein BrxL, partial [Gammaproteobacteria bacterium]